MKALHPKILELKQRASAINYSTVSINDKGELEGDFIELLDKRIIQGYLLRWGTVNKHKEMFFRGCCAKSISERGPQSNANYKMTFLNQHRQYEALCHFDELVEDDYGLRFRSKPLDDVPWADYVLKQVRSGTLNQFSAGFNYVWDKTEWDDNTNTIICKEIDLYEGSVVTIGSEEGTYVIRSAEDQNDLLDDIEHFVKQLPRKQQLEARNLFARQKTLAEPLEQRTITLTEPAGNGIDYNYLINNI